MNVIFPMYFGEKRGCSSAGSSSSSRKLKKCFSCYTYALEWGQQQCPCKFQLLVFLNTPSVQCHIGPDHIFEFGLCHFFPNNYATFVNTGKLESYSNWPAFSGTRISVSLSCHEVKICREFQLL